jgi:hypothetical protein
MYCQSSGAESALDLNYCSRCGANMGQALVSAPQIVPFNFTKPALIIGLTTVLLTLGGFGVLAIAAYNLAVVFQHPDPILALLVFGMATIALSDIMLIRLLSRIVRSSLEPKQMVPLPRPVARQVREHGAREWSQPQALLNTLLARSIQSIKR